MHISHLLTNYQPFDDAEAKVTTQLASLLSTQTPCIDKNHFPVHLTGSTMVLAKNPEPSILLINHKKLKRWLQPGGHAEGDYDLTRVARRELQEETGVALPLDQFSLLDFELQPIPAYYDIPEHFHLDVRFSAVLETQTVLIPQLEEVAEARWWPIESLSTLWDADQKKRIITKIQSILLI